MTFITLTGYYPKKHNVHLRADHVTAIAKNVINEKSSGSTVYAGACAFHVSEEPQDIIAKIDASEAIDEDTL